MHIEVKNKADIERCSAWKNKDKSVVISIRSHDRDKANIIQTEENNIKELLFVEFDDVDSEIKGGISQDNIENIAGFIRKTLDYGGIDKIIVQCEAGQSRSAGIAAAIMKYIWDDDTSIFLNKRYTPNMYCYRRLLKELMKEDY